MTPPPRILYAGKSFRYDTCPDCGKQKLKASSRCQVCAWNFYTESRSIVEQPDDPSYRIMPLTHGQITILDADDYERFAQFVYGAHWSNKTQSYYARRSFNDPETGRVIHFFLHREILGLARNDKRQGDHANHDTLDNRKFIDGKPQLRIATRAQNQWNTGIRRTNKSGYKGVSRLKGRNKWRATARRDGKRHFLGDFDDPKEANAAYVAFVTEYDGQFACIENKAPAT
jgi:AP2 domain